MAKRSGSYEYADAVAFLESHSKDNPWLQAPRSRTLQRKTLDLANPYNFHVYYFYTPAAVISPVPPLREIKFR